MMPPNNIKYVRAFLGLLNYYRDMWAKWSHLLHSLTSLTSTEVEFKWTYVEQKEFDKIKQIFACDTLLIYTDFNEHFYIHTDASDFQLGAVIRQNGKLIDFYSRKLTEAQSHYTVMEKELLSIVKTLILF